MVDLSTLSCAAFAPLLGGAVALVGQDGHTLAATLATAVEIPKATARNAPRTAFTLVFTVPLPCDVAVGDFTLQHPELGEIGPIHMARVQPGEINASVAAFQAAFN